MLQNNCAVKNVVVIGTQWGDEGKGKIVDWLTDHAQGVVRGRDNDTLVKHLRELKDRFETSPEHVFSSLPAEYVEALVPLIECIDIVVSDLKCIFKLSQNRKLEEFDRTVENLSLNFAKFKQEYFLQNSKGAGEAAGAIGWDVKVNKKV